MHQKKTQFDDGEILIIISNIMFYQNFCKCCDFFLLLNKITAIDDLVLFEIIFNEDYLTQGLIKQWAQVWFCLFFSFSKCILKEGQLIFTKTFQVKKILWMGADLFVNFKFVIF